MSSVFRHFQKRVINGEPLTLRQDILDHDLIRVDISSVTEDIAEQKKIGFFDEIVCDPSAPLPRPQFPNMWLESCVEFNNGDLAKVGFLVKTYHSEDESVVIECWWENWDYPVWKFKFEIKDGVSCASTGTVKFWGSEEGANIQDLIELEKDLESGPEWARSISPPIDETRKWWQGLLAYVTVAIHAISRMNAHNVALVDAPSRSGVHCHRNPKLPMSIWKKIVIDDSPKYRRIYKNENANPQNRRLHHVRGHFADYRNGNGHFGDPSRKYVLWIPEHRRGKEELGEIVPEYVMA